MKCFWMKTPTARTEIVIDEGLMEQAAEIVAKRLPGRRTVVVTDSLLLKTHAKKFIAGMRNLREVVVLQVPRGEAAKKISVVERLCERMHKARIGRDDSLVALGGGSVGDTAGFAAAVYMRGIPFAQIPTTLNAQADSGIGGKTGINLPTGKNIVGAFHQPRLVLIDPCVLSTLPQRDFNAGMAEVVKTALIGSPELFLFIESETAGEITIELLDTSQPGAPRSLGLYVHNDPQQLRRLWYGGFWSDHYTIKCPWDPAVGPPSQREVTIKVTFTDFLTGKQFTATKVVEVSLPGPASAAALSAVN